MGSSYEDAQAIRAWIVERLTLSIDNDQGRLTEVQDAAREAIAEDMGSTAPSLDTYRNGDTRDDYAPAIGSRVADLVGAWLDNDVTSQFLRIMLDDVLDLSDREFQVMLGSHYMPDPDDMVGLLEDDDADDDADEE